MIFKQPTFISIYYETSKRNPRRQHYYGRQQAYDRSPLRRQRL